MTTETPPTPGDVAEPGLLGSGSAVVLPDSVSLPPTDTRDAWLAQRSRGIGGSDVSAILGLNRWSSPLQVWLEKTGRAKEKRRTWAMLRGSALESSLLDWFQDHEGITVHRTIPTQSNRVDPWMLGNLDGVGGDSSVIETKTTNWHLREEWADGQVADHAELQAQWYMAVTGLRHAWVIVAVSDDEPTWTPLEADQDLQATMHEACGKFWRDHVLADKEPPATAADVPVLRKREPIPGTPVSGEQEAAEWACNYFRWADAEKVAKSNKADAQARLLQALGDGSHLVVGDQVVATRTAFDKAEYTVAARRETRLNVPAPDKRKKWTNGK